LLRQDVLKVLGVPVGACVVVDEIHTEQAEGGSVQRFTLG
jgi:hypothetical protein